MSNASKSEAVFTRGPEGIRLILYQVHIMPRPKQLQLGLQLQNMQQGGSQCRMGPQRTTLAVAVSIQPSSRSATIDRDASSEDGLSTSPNTRS
jgi:hypothetical protein